MSTEIALLQGEQFTQEELQIFENQYLAVFQDLAEVTKQKKALELQEKQVKARLEKVMDDYCIKSLKNQFIKITRVEGSSSTTIDLKLLEEKEPNLYNELIQDYPKTTTKKAYIRFDVK